jgi:hypothetical protein
MPKTFFQFLFFILFVSLAGSSCFPGKNYFHWKGKPVLATYSGGHHSYVALTLYKDSTFRYMTKDDMLGMGVKKSGAYLKTDTSITLYQQRSKNYYKTSPGETFRIRGEYVLMFPAAKERTADSSFYRDYYTLSLDK